MNRPMDVAVIGVPKSGTTMLCNAMTVPARAVVLYEPFTVGFTGARLRRQVASLGCRDDDVVGWARGHDRWGVKEVLAEGIRGVLDLQPGRVLLLVRDLRHVALSVLETNRRIPWDLAIRRRRVVESARVLVDVQRSWPRGRSVLCRYEDFVASAGYREAVRRQLGWPAFDGDVSRGLATWLERPHEAGRHGGRITANSVAYRRGPLSPAERSFATELAAACAPYQELFGYGGDVPSALATRVARS